ncbi:BTAD domain-containing putative transcriptional regulator [Antrihabitans sp. YC2-6]|uniref:AfsR/SARP family transcriptional regulator n=1 Tax=Antrihabitans sp. YC2-6 TaxID=2799498 RepID=UPI0027DAD054|nr:BTAD domain-containing putative transcriptional regulator [Antrihabitans sp. YC2-6]
MHPELSVPNSLTPAGQSVIVALLGEVSTRRDGALVVLPGARARSLLVALAEQPGRSRTAQALIDDVWGEEPPRSPMNALHTQVSRLRAALPEGVLEAGPGGYRLALTKSQVDVTLARLLEQRAQQRHAEGDHRGCLDVVDQAKALWRGDPGADLADGPLARQLRAEADARRAALDAVEVAALLALGEFGAALPTARARAAHDPLDEAAHSELMQVLVGMGCEGDALEVFATFRTRLADELGADPSKSLVELNTAILRGENATRPPVRAIPSAIGLRAAPNALLGRAVDIAAIEELLASARVTTVLGPGGTGKTRIANEIGTRSAKRKSVVLVELASVRSGNDVVAAISATLGVSEVVVEPGSLTRARVHTIRERLREAVSARPMVLILDNCEHVIDDVAEVVADLVSVSTGLTVLTTSRAPLMITAEAVYPLPPLQIAESGSPATDLFRARAKAVRPNARLDPAEVTRLCRTLDGLPLAIELAAARVRTMSVEDINVGLGNRFALLRSGDRSSPERHRTLHAVIDWSWNLLDAAERAALRRLCRFPAGFTLDAAIATAEWGEVDDVHASLDGLVNQSMLALTEHDDPVGVRYHMLETVREFGEEQLVEADEVMARMSSWAQDFAIGMAGAVHSNRQVAAALLVEAEHDNLLAVLRHALEVEDARTVYTVFAALGVLWAVRGAHSEVFTWAPRILAIDLRGADEAAVPASMLVASYMLAGMHLLLGGNVRAVALARTRIRRSRQRTDMDSVTRLHADLLLSPVSGKGVARTLAVAVRSADEWTRTTALGARANIRENIGDVRGSIRDAEMVLKLATARGDRWTASMICQHLGSVYGQSARYAESVTYYRHAVEALYDLHAWNEIAQVRAFIGASLVGVGKVEEARRELQDLLGADGEPTGTDWSSLGAGNPHLAGITGSLAEADLAEGDIDSGLARYLTALAYAEWPANELTPGPLSILLASAAVSAHVVHGRAAAVGDLARELGEAASARLRKFPDLPQLGCVASALGSYRIAAGQDPELGMELLALARRIGARQDYPSMRLAGHLEAARSVLGDETVNRELNRTAKVPRTTATARILENVRI